MTAPTPADTYEYEAGPSVFMSGHSDWIIRRTGKPGIVATVVGHEDHAQAAVNALNQAARHDVFTANLMRVEADRLAAALHIALHDAHPVYGSTATWRGGIGGQTVTAGCAITDPPPDQVWLANALSETERGYIQRWGPGTTHDARRALMEEISAHSAQRPAITPPETAS